MGLSKDAEEALGKIIDERLAAANRDPGEQKARALIGDVVDEKLRAFFGEKEDAADKQPRRQQQAPKGKKTGTGGFLDVLLGGEGE